MLGLDTRVHAHLPFEGPDSFFYPERLYYAAILSLWFQFLISLTLTSATRGFCGQLFAFGERISELEALAEAHIQPQTLVALGASEVSPLGAILITFCVNGYFMLGFSGNVQSLVDFLQSEALAYATPFATAAGIVAGIVHAFMHASFFRRYRRRIFDMRTGRYFFVRGQYDETGSSSFIGYQVAFMVFSTGVLLTVFFTIICAVGGGVVGIVLMLIQPADAPEEETASTIRGVARLEALAPSSPAGEHIDAYTTYAEVLSMRTSIAGVPWFVWWFVVPFLFQFILNKCLWFVPATRLRNGDIANRWLRFRFWYAIYEYLLILPNVAIGLVFIVLRSIVAWFLWIYYTFSIDICLVPSGTGIEASDAGHSAYVAVARNDHRYNNPIVMVFLGLVQDELSRRRLEAGRIKVRTQLRKNIAERRAVLSEVNVIDKMQRLAKAGSTTGSLKPSADVAIDISAGIGGPALAGDKEHIPSADELISAANKRRLCIRRWQLAYTMIHNPTLINMRANRLATYDLTIPEAGESFFVSRGKDFMERTGSVAQGIGSSLAELSTSAAAVASPLAKQLSFGWPGQGTGSAAAAEAAAEPAAEPAAEAAAEPAA